MQMKIEVPLLGLRELCCNLIHYKPGFVTKGGGVTGYFLAALDWDQLKEITS